MAARRTHGLAVVVIIAGLLLFLPPLLFWSGALGDGAALKHWAGGALFRLGLGDGSRLVVHDERGVLDVHVVHGQVVRVLLDGADVPVQRQHRDGDVLTVLAADGSEWGQVSLGFATDGSPGARGEVGDLHAGVEAAMRRLTGRLRDDVAAHMGAALSALDPPLPQPVLATLDESVSRAAAACVEHLDRTVTTDDPDEAGSTTCRVDLDRDDLVEEFADAFEDALAEAGTPLAWPDVTRVRQALSRAGARLPVLEYRPEP